MGVSSESEIQRVRHAYPAHCRGGVGGEGARFFSKMRQWGLSLLLDLVTLFSSSPLFCLENFVSPLMLIGEILKGGGCHPTRGEASGISAMKTR